ncbi:MAG: molybdate ABC transporter substrate-binding protein [Parvibaculum sp.]|uniref:molybdate ABC transporter substrate-binding protein n=1 Tax=Parvibaculum sp. TaxID=2024848 RepID=UPI0025E6132E|nr:molybdate ABC transporter substrate-binding protein [Parvibaculum sp.]MCE9648398.1 molybdate ABC transporter substrate-binding protein [Parvibaculum sp.]
MFRFRAARTALAAVFFIAVSFSTAYADADKTLVFAAASLTDVLTAIGKDYEAETGKKVVLSFASSSVLARQIEASPGADIFFSADEEWMDYLATRGLIRADTRADLLGNELVLVAPAGSTMNLPVTQGFPLLDALHGGRLAIGDPDSVPAGKYGRSALTSLGVWGSVVDHLAQAENVRVALAYVARGETPLGIVYKTDALAQKKVRVVGAFPEDSHLPITYPVALTKTAGPEAASFLAYLGTPKAIEIFAKAGFTNLARGQ